MTDWDDYRAGLTTLSGLNDQLKKRLDAADVVFRRSADDLARERDDTDAVWQKVGDRARNAKAMAHSAAARVGVVIDTQMPVEPVDRETVDRRLQQLEKNAAWCEQAAGWLLRHRVRMEQAEAQVSNPVAVTAPPQKPTAPPPPPPKNRWVVPLVIGLLVVIVLILLIVVIL